MDQTFGSTVPLGFRLLFLVTIVAGRPRNTANFGTQPQAEPQPLPNVMAILSPFFQRGGLIADTDPQGKVLNFTGSNIVAETVQNVQSAKKVGGGGTLAPPAGFMDDVPKVESSKPSSASTLPPIVPIPSILQVSGVQNSKQADLSGGLNGFGEASDFLLDLLKEKDGLAALMGLINDKTAVQSLLPASITKNGAKP